MLLRLSHNNRILKTDLSQAVDISLPVVFEPGLCRAWQAPLPKEQPIDYGKPASVASGFSVNSFEFKVAPHSHCTHTEWAAHFLTERPSLPLNIIPILMPALLITVIPRSDEKGQLWIKASDLETLFIPEEKIPAVLFRTWPNSPEKITKNYTQTQPPAFEPEAMIFLKNNGVYHLITDLPSVDPESDEGRLSAHRLFLSNEDSSIIRTITELVFIPDTLKDGLYILNLQLAPIPGDAVPSRPLISPVIGF